MIKITRTSTRPNTDIPFFSPEKSFNDYFVKTYVETGKVTRAETTLSEDGLTKTVVNLYSSEADMIEARDDAVVIDGYITKSVIYNNENGITSTVLVEQN